MTAWPSSWAALTRSTVAAGTRYHSAYGGSPASCELTPVCSVIGAIPTPLVTRRVTTSGVNPRDALGISALPGSIPKAVW